MKSLRSTQDYFIYKFIRRRWYIILAVLFIFSSIIFFPKYERFIRPIRSYHVPSYTPPKPLPLESTKFTLLKGVPKVIHQSWKNEIVPERFLQWQKRWKDFHPQWEYHLWTDDDNRELVKKHYPFFLATYDSFSMGVMRADSVRYLYMHKYGGLYADLDMDPIKSTDELLNNINLNENKPNVVLGHMGDDYAYPHNVPNAWMISTPGHPFWLYCITKIMQHMTEGGNGAEHLTGPVMLYRAAQDYAETQRRITGTSSPGVENGATKVFDLTVLKPGLIYPFDWHKPQKDQANICAASKSQNLNDEKCKAQFPEAYTITYWTHSWE
jgi:hypothetical protein